MDPIDLSDLKTYPLASRPSKVDISHLGQPHAAGIAVGDWLDSLPKQLAANDLRRVRDNLCRARADGRTVVAALGGHVIKTGCAPYLIDWIEQGLITAVAMNGAAAIHDFELAYVGKTSEDVASQLPAGKFGFARETADAFAEASRIGATGVGLGAGLGQYMAGLSCAHPEASLVLAAWRAGVPCTVHVAVGADIVHMHAQLSGADLGEATLSDFRRLCAVVGTMARGVWLNLGSAVMLPEVFLKAVSVVRNLGADLDGLVTVNVDKESHYRSTVNVLRRPASEGLELTGHHEILIPLLHAAVAAKLAQGNPVIRPGTAA